VRRDPNQIPEKGKGDRAVGIPAGGIIHRQDAKIAKVGERKRREKTKRSTLRFVN
jgi:hypothetical protein